MEAEPLSCRILFVEDHKDTAEVFARALELKGYTVRIAHDCASALALASRSYFDLLLGDIALPDGDGCDLLCKLREMPHLRQLRAIAFSACGSPDDVNRARAAGFEGHVLKPVEIEELVGLIERVRCFDGQHSSSVHRVGSSPVM